MYGSLLEKCNVDDTPSPYTDASQLKAVIAILNDCNQAVGREVLRFTNMPTMEPDAVIDCGIRV
jgi:hypothetical protein